MVVKQRRLERWLADVGGARAFAALADAYAEAAVFAVDADRDVVYWSAGAEQLLGFAAADVVGEHCLKSNRCVRCMTGCGVQEHATIAGASLELHRADGSAVRVRKYARALRDDDGAFQGAVEVLVPDREPAAKRLAVVEGGDVEVFHGLVSRDARMKELFALVRNVARTDATVLVRGESGTGKELFARAIHAESPRRAGPFLAVNCAAMTPTLLESELFGHEKGAFTGATQAHQGVFERADRGTLFLDEVGELPLELQAKLLRVLQERTFFRVGGTKSVKVDVRIVSATHRALRKETAAGRFREDLLYRLRVVPLFVPPLRERPGDVPLLVQRFVADLHAKGVEPDAMRALLAWDWPGNVRELRNAIEYASAVSSGDAITAADLPRDLFEAPARAAVATRARRPLDEAAIRRALADADGHVGEAAARLGVSRPTLWRRRKQLGI